MILNKKWELLANRNASCVVKTYRAARSSAGVFLIEMFFFRGFQVNLLSSTNKQNKFKSHNWLLGGPLV